MKTNVMYKGVQYLAVLSGLLLLVFSSGCGDRRAVLDEGPTRGDIKIAADESFKLLIDSEVNTFLSLYSYASIAPHYLPEADVVAELLNDSVRMIVITRDLTEAEKNQLASTQVIARTTKYAYDAVAFILNPENPVNNLRYDQIQGMIDGSITQWNQIDDGSKMGEVVVVFDHNKSGNFRFLKEKFLEGKPVPSQLFAQQNNAEVLQYVKTKRNALGVIGLNWISDKDDTISNKFLKEIKVAAVGRPGDTEGEGNFVKPYQGYIADGSYPFKREVYAICRESFTGLGTGFVQFIAGDVGQRIVLKSGLVPATMPVRLVQISKKNLQ